MVIKNNNEDGQTQSFWQQKTFRTNPLKGAPSLSSNPSLQYKNKNKNKNKQTKKTITVTERNPF